MATTKSEADIQYGPTDYAKNVKPRIFIGKKEVVLGGDVEIKRLPPKAGRFVPEATPEEYAAAFKMGYTRYVKVL